MLCPVCGHQDVLNSTYCPDCRTRLDRGRRVTNEEALNLETKRDAAVRKGRIARRMLVALVALLLLVVGGWTGYQTLGGANRLISPVSVVSASPTGGDWPMFQRSPAHAGFVADEVPIPKGHIRWRFETEAPILSSPAVVKGTVYMSTGDRRIVALKADTGDVIWER